LIGFGSSAIANVRNESRIIGNNRNQVRIICRLGTAKRVSSPNCTLSFIAFLSVCSRPAACRAYPAGRMLSNPVK
jgi:hypothetical protein